MNRSLGRILLPRADESATDLCKRGLVLVLGVVVAAGIGFGQWPDAAIRALFRDLRQERGALEGYSLFGDAHVDAYKRRKRSPKNGLLGALVAGPKTIRLIPIWYQRFRQLPTNWNWTERAIREEARVREVGGNRWGERTEVRRQFYHEVLESGRKYKLKLTRAGFAVIDPGVYSVEVHSGGGLQAHSIEKSHRLACPLQFTVEPGFVYVLDAKVVIGAPSQKRVHYEVDTGGSIIHKSWLKDVDTHTFRAELRRYPGLSAKSTEEEYEVIGACTCDWKMRGVSEDAPLSP